MKHQLRFPIHPLLAAVIVAGGLFVALFAAYGLTRWVSSGEVIGSVTVAEVDVGAKTEDETYDTVSAIEIGRLSRLATFTIDGEEVNLEPGYTALDVDVEGAVAEAMAVGRTGNFANQFLFWLTNMFSTTDVAIEGTLSDIAMGELFDEWDTEVIAQPIEMGSVALEDGVLVAHYPQTGVGIEREPAYDIVLESLLATHKEIRAIPTVVVDPELTNEDVDIALTEAEEMLSGPITLTWDEREAVVAVDQLQEAFASETVTNSPARIDNYFDPIVVDSILAPLREDFESAPVDARLVVNDDLTVSVNPGESGTRIDEEETAARLYEASLDPSRTGELPIVEGAEPDVTTEYLEGLRIEHLVSQFTTFHDCCGARVTNIHLMADAIDGAIVLPGNTFSINDYVGERTEAGGYLPAGSIVGGEIVDTIGGGVSQFATTFYNTVFWGGYQDVEHQPHSYYFSRYPQGVEATLFWRSIDLKFRNNREHAILIDTLYTDTSITVRFFGFNHGRTLVGEQSGGNTHIRVANEGGPDALHVKGETSDPYNVTEPGDTVYRGSDEVGLNSERRVQSAAEGWTVSVVRRILEGGTELLEEQEWVWRYRPQVEIIEVHPCKVPGTSTSCPTTTTSPPATTTTTQPPATTTTPTAPPSTSATTTTMPTPPTTPGG